MKESPVNVGFGPEKQGSEESLEALRWIHYRFHPQRLENDLRSDGVENASIELNKSEIEKKAAYEGIGYGDEYEKRNIREIRLGRLDDLYKRVDSALEHCVSSLVMLELEEIDQLEQESCDLFVQAEKKQEAVKKMSPGTIESYNAERDYKQSIDDKKAKVLDIYKKCIDRAEERDAKARGKLAALGKLAAWQGEYSNLEFKDTRIQEETILALMLDSGEYAVMQARGQLTKLARLTDPHETSESFEKLKEYAEIYYRVVELLERAAKNLDYPQST